MWNVSNEDIASKITEEQLNEIEDTIDAYVRGAIEDNLNRDVCSYEVNYDGRDGSGYVSIYEVKPIINVDGVDIVLSAEINFDVVMESGGGWDEPSWGEIKEYCYDGDITLTDMDGEYIVAYDTSSGWMRF